MENGVTENSVKLYLPEIEDRLKIIQNMLKWKEYYGDITFDEKIHPNSNFYKNQQKARKLKMMKKLKKRKKKIKTKIVTTIKEKKKWVKTLLEMIII